MTYICGYVHLYRSHLEMLRNAVGFWLPDELLLAASTVRCTGMQTNSQLMISLYCYFLLTTQYGTASL